ncbi:MAG: hypothetical protein AMJ56_03580 [Anaerolineae bacterium SG8_19]|jgi:hypothetical protein|nr:MAG: hypothetical protein AMJ56_03580 [Anaerolineae bacterium SG8_19]
MIVDHILENRPRVPSFVRAPAEEFISRLLQRPILGVVLEKSAEAADAVVTGGAAAEISIDLEKVVPFVDTLLTTIAPELAEGFENASAPGPIKVIESGELPRIRQLAQILPWLWPLATLGAVAVYALAFWRTLNRRETALFIGLGVVITSLIALVFILAIGLAVENNISNASVQVIIGEVMAVFTRDLFIQSVILMIIGLVVIVAGRYFLKDDLAVAIAMDELGIEEQELTEEDKVALEAAEEEE